MFDTMNRATNPKSVQLNIRLTPESLAKINEGRDKYAETLRKSKMSMSEFIDSRCSIDNMPDITEEDMINACVSSINFNKDCIALFENLMVMIGNGKLGQELYGGNDSLVEFIERGKAIVRRMQNCAGIPTDHISEEE